jgi:hypothetical protein
MVRLGAFERDSIEVIERRIQFLEHRIPKASEENAKRDKREREALQWALEVIALAAGMDCEEAFTYTTMRVIRTERTKQNRQTALKHGSTLSPPPVIKLSLPLQKIYDKLR